METQTVRVNLDARRAEQDLGRFEGRVDSLINELEGITVGVDVDDSALASVQKTLDGLDATIDASVEVDDSELGVLNAAIEDLNRAIVVAVDADDSDVLAAIGEVDRLAARVQSLAGNNVAVDLIINDSGLAAVRRKLEDLEEPIEPEVKPDTSQLPGFENKLQDIAKRAGTSLGLAFAAAAGLGIQSAFDQQRGSVILDQAFGLSDQDAEFAGFVAGQLYSRGLGEGFEENVRTTGSVARALDEFDESLATSLEDSTERALKISDILGVDLASSINATSQLVRNDLAASFEEAQGLIIRGFQENDARAEDLLDTVNEYGVTFRQLGLDGADAFQVLSNALDAGARDTDKAADAFKEFALRTVEGTEEVQDALDALSLEGIGERVGQGGQAARDALFEVLDAIDQLEAGAERDNVVRVLFGSPGEDLTSEVVASLGRVGDQYDDAAEAAERFNDEVQLSSSRLEGFKRDAFQGLGNAGEDIAALFTGNFSRVFGGQFAEDVETLQAQILQDQTSEFVSAYRDHLDGIIDAGIGAFQSRVDELTPAVEVEVPSEIAEGFGKIADEIDEVNNGAQVLLAQLGGPLRDAVEGVLASGIFTDEDARTLSIILDEQGLRDQLEAAGTDIEGFLTAVETITNERATVLAENFSAALGYELDRIADQLSLTLEIDTENGINDVRDLINETESVLDQFNRRQDAAQKVDLLGLDDLAARVRSGELDELIDDILEGEGGTTDELLRKAEASLEAVAKAQAEASAAAAKAAREAFEEEFVNGSETDPIRALLNSAHLAPEDFLEIAANVTAGLEEALAADDERGQRVADALFLGISDDAALRQRAADGVAIADAVADGFVTQTDANGALVITAVSDLPFADPEGLLVAHRAGESLADEIADGVSEHFLDRRDGIANLGGTAAADFVAGFVDGLSASAGTLQSAVEQALQGAVPAVTPFATGGTIKRPTFALMGEAGTETVVPEYADIGHIRRLLGETSILRRLETEFSAQQRRSFDQFNAQASAMGQPATAPIGTSMVGGPTYNDHSRIEISVIDGGQSLASKQLTARQAVAELRRDRERRRQRVYHGGAAWGG